MHQPVSPCTSSRPLIALPTRQIQETPIVWWIVALIVLLILAGTLIGAMAIWCSLHGGGEVISWQVHWPFVTIGSSK
uniref:Uncharacterized protein n=1 Tax=Thermogemmatispora argillosa TaxID=2045280 RepID=A0A455T0P9_9CHLR|nr:hypothetical protein KTA_11480 [Thermogemmatispora argillosa]